MEGDHKNNNQGTESDQALQTEADTQTLKEPEKEDQHAQAFGLPSSRIEQILAALEIPRLRARILSELSGQTDNDKMIVDRVRSTAAILGMDYPDALKANQDFVASMAKGKTTPLDTVLADNVWDGKDRRERIFIAALIRQAVSGFELDQVDELIQRLARSNPRKKPSIIENAATATPMKISPQWPFKVDEKWTFTGDEDHTNSGFTTAAGKVSN
jgi:hypothetical protein